MKIKKLERGSGVVVSMKINEEVAKLPGEVIKLLREGVKIITIDISQLPGVTAKNINSLKTVREKIQISKGQLHFFCTDKTDEVKNQLVEAGLIK